MKGFGYFFFVLCTITLIITVMPTEREGEIYEDTVRLHILANSDNARDQEIKLSIRDYILECGYLDADTLETKADAEGRLRDGIPEVENAICERLSDMGVGYGAKITLTEEWYDTREYEDFTLPMGYYTSYRVVLGEGTGQNWWCVMYPPICKGLSTDNSRDDAVKYSGEEYSLISSGKYRLKFKILEVLSQRFKK